MLNILSHYDTPARERLIDLPYICMMRKKNNLTPQDEAIDEWLSRNSWIIWFAILAITVAVVSLIGMFMF